MKLKNLDRMIVSINATLLILIFGALALACGTQVKVKGSTSHEANVNGKVTQELVIKLDVSACSKLAGVDQSQCIKDTVAALGDLVELVKTLSCKDADCLSSSPE